MEEIEIAEQEGYTAVYRELKRKKKHRRRNGSSAGKTRDSKETISLNPFIVGAKPLPTLPTQQQYGMNTKLYKNDINQLVRDTLEEIGGSHISTKSALPEQGGRFFLGECTFDDDITSILQTTRIWKFKKTGRKGLDKFRRAVEFVKFTMKMFNCQTTKQLTQQETILFFWDTLITDRLRKRSKLLFDMAPFKSLGQKSFVDSIKDVLQKTPTKRTEKDVSVLLHVLGNLSKFSSYPQHIQQGLCRKGWYSRFDSSRVITREGNRPEFYYFILSGIAVSRYLGNTIKPEERRRQLAEFHRQGDVIGEKDILTNSPRNTTFVSKEPVEVLGLDRDIFLDIFKSSGGTACLNFLRTIPDLEDFPLELLQTHYFNYYIHYYKRGAVIVKNSNDVEWVYVVRSGSCQVFKELRRSENQGKYTEKREQTTLLPPPRSERRDSLSTSRSSEENKTTYRAKSSSSNQKSTKTQLPSINKAKNSLVTQNYKDKDSPRNEVHSKTKKDCQNTESLPIYYVKIDIVAERQCFGLQSLVFNKNPSLSLVSNGVECVLISKQFLREHMYMNREIKRRLQFKVAPYPKLSQMQNAVDEKLAWESYRGKVLHDTIWSQE